MCYKLMIRERGKDKFNHQGDFDGYEAAVEEGRKLTTDTGFDGFQVWELRAQYEIQPALVLTKGMG